MNRPVKTGGSPTPSRRKPPAKPRNPVPATHTNRVGGLRLRPWVIRVEAGISTARFCRLFDMAERTWRRWQAIARSGTSAGKGPWPRPARMAVRDLAMRHALAHPAWGHRKILAMTRHNGHVVSQSTPCCGCCATRH